MGKKYQKNKSEQILLNIIHIFSYLILFTPLILNSNFFFPFVGPKSLYFMALSQIIFFSWLVLIFINPKYKPKFNLVLLGLILYLFIFILASILGVNFSYSFWSKFERMTGILMHLHLFCFFLALSSVFREEDFKKIFGFSIFVAILVSIVALVNLKNPTMRGGGTIGNESFLGTYLIFNCFFAFYLIFKTQGFVKNISIFSFLILFFSLLLIGTSLENLSFFQKISAIFFSQGARAAKISFYGGLVLLFFLWLIVSQRRIFKIFGFFLLISSIIFGVYATLSLIFQPEGIFRKIVEKEVGSFGGRFPVWQGAIKGFLERPLIGWGPENFEIPFAKYFHPCMGTPRCGGEIWFDRAHNIIFDTLISTGIFGLIFYSLIFVFSFLSLWKNFLKKKTDFFSAGIFTSLFVSYFVQNLTVFDMVSSFMVFFLSLAFIASFEKEQKELIFERKEIHPVIFSSILILFLFCFFYFIIFPLKADATVISAIKLPPFSPERLSAYQRALSYSPLGKFQIRQFFAETSMQNFYSFTASNQQVKNEIEFLVGELKKSIKESPLDFRSYLRLAQLLTIYSQFDNEKIFEAEEISKKAIELSPTNQQGLWVLSQLKVIQGKIDEAVFLAQKAVELEPNLLNSHLVLIQILKFGNKEDLAKEKFEEAIKINSDWEEELKKILRNP